MARRRVEWGAFVPHGLGSVSCDVGFGSMGLKLEFSFGLDGDWECWTERLGPDAVWVCFVEEVRGFVLVLPLGVSALRVGIELR